MHEIILQQTINVVPMDGTSCECSLFPVELSLFSVTSQVVCSSAGDKNLSITKEL